jgi:hypothetical protein
VDPCLPSFSSAVQNVFVFLYGNTFEYYGGAEALRVDCQDKAGSSHTGLSQVHSESVPPFLFPCTSCSSPFNFILANSTCALWGLIMMAAFRAASFVRGAHVHVHGPVTSLRSRNPSPRIQAPDHVSSRSPESKSGSRSTSASTSSPIVSPSTVHRPPTH